MTLDTTRKTGTMTTLARSAMTSAHQKRDRRSADTPLRASGKPLLAVACAHVMTHKNCIKCNQSKPVGEFYKHARSKDGRSGTCKVCHAAHNAAYYRKNKEARKKYLAVYRPKHEKANRGQYLAKYARRRALKKKATQGDQRAVQAIYDRAATERSIRCYICGKNTSRSNRHVDHIIPLVRGGLHSAENLAIACAFCNSSKRDLPLRAIGMLPFDDACSSIQRKDTD